MKRPILRATLAACLVAPALPASASDDTERAQLAVMIRRLDVLDLAARRGEALAPPEGRHHFDYARFSADMARVRAGVTHYLTPTRAQPRDPFLLTADYRQNRPVTCSLPAPAEAAP